MSDGAAVDAGDAPAKVGAIAVTKAPPRAMPFVRCGHNQFIRTAAIRYVDVKQRKGDKFDVCLTVEGKLTRVIVWEVHGAEDLHRALDQLGIDFDEVCIRKAAETAAAT